MTNHETEKNDLEVSVNLLTENRISTRSLKHAEVNQGIIKNDLLCYLVSGGLSIGFFASGFTLVSFGLSLPTFAENLKLNIDDVSPALVARGTGYLSGSILSGIMEKKFFGVYVMVFNLVLMCCGLLLTPTILNPISMYIFTGLTAFGMGGCEAIGNVLCLQLWRGRSGQDIFIQFLHFWFCVGGALTPFLLKPFINEAVSFDQNITSNFSIDLVNESVFRDVNYISESVIPYVSIPYLLMGGIVFSLAIYLFLCIYCCSEQSFTPEEGSSDKKYSKFRYGMLAQLFFCYFLYIGFEVTFSTFLYTFTLSNAPAMDYSKDKAAVHFSILYFSVVVGQFITIFISKSLKPGEILLIDLVGTGLSSTLLLFLPYYTDIAYVLFWIGVGGIGLFSASIYGTVLLWADRYIVVDARATCIFIVGGSLGEMVLPIPVGNSIESYPMSLLYYTAAYIGAFLLLCLIMWKVASAKGERKTRKECDISPNKDSVQPKI